MVCRVKKAHILVTVISFLLFWSQDAWPQPFGIGSSQAQLKKQQEVLSSAQGRFAFGQISDSSKDQFMLDTFTGRLWRISETGEVGLFLSPVPYRASKGKYSPLPENGPNLLPKEAEEGKNQPK